MEGNNLIKLDISGTHMIASTSLLTCIPDSSLAAMFSGNHDLTMNEGRVYIERDPETFNQLLFFLKHKIFPKATDLMLFKFECDYWCMQETEIYKKALCHSRLANLYGREPMLQRKRDGINYEKELRLIKLWATYGPIDLHAYLECDFTIAFGFNHSEYEGQVCEKKNFSNDPFAHGFGRFITHEYIHEGCFNKGKANGYGRRIMPSQVLDGQWKDGEF